MVRKLKPQTLQGLISRMRLNAPDQWQPRREEGASLSGQRTLRSVSDPNKPNQTDLSLAAADFQIGVDKLLIGVGEGLFLDIDGCLRSHRVEIGFDVILEFALVHHHLLSDLVP